MYTTKWYETHNKQNRVKSDKLSVLDIKEYTTQNYYQNTKFLFKS